MRDPSEHLQNRGFFETILRRLPGFGGYLEREYRRDADQLQRHWLADRLQRSKAGLDELARSLADRAAIDDLPECDRLRGRLDKLIASIRGAMQGYSGFFDLAQVDEQTLDRVYERDVAIMEQVEALAEAVERAPQQTGTVSETLKSLAKQVDGVQREWLTRAEILQGLE